MTAAPPGSGKARWPGVLPGVLVLLLAMASTHATAQSCTVGSGGALAFGSVVALASTPHQTTDSGQSFKVRCDSGVAGTLRLYSATPRVLQNNASSLPFNLSLNSGAANDDLPTAPLGAPFDITRNGTDQAVTLYAKIYTQNFKSLPGGLYSAAIVLTVEY
jgi:spore coat protein U-like protein